MFKKRSKKGALELSMNTIVIIVIGVTLLILGLTFVRGIFTKIGGLTEGAFEKAEGQIGVDANLDEPLNVIPPKISLKIGESKETTIVLANQGENDAKNVAVKVSQVKGKFKGEVECIFTDTGTEQTTVDVLKSGRFTRLKVRVSIPDTGSLGDNACLFQATGLTAGTTEKGTLMITATA